MFIASDADIKKPRYRRYEQIFIAKTYSVPIYSLDEFYSIAGLTREEITNCECCGFCRYSKNKLNRTKRCSSGENEYFHEFFRRLDESEAAFASERRQFFAEYVKCCIPSDEAQDKVLKDKKFTISKDMERVAPRNLFVINQIIVNCGGWICNKASESDYYIATDDEYGDPDPGEKTRMFSAVINDVPVISIKELCGMAGYAEDEFSSLRCSDFCKTAKAVLDSEPSKISPPDSIEPTIFELITKQKYAR